MGYPMHRTIGRAVTFAHLALDPIRAHDRLVREQRSVITLGIPPIQITYLLGPQANLFAFANPDLFTWRDAYQSLSVVSGDSALLLSDGRDHRRRRDAVTSAFTPRRIEGYREAIAASAHRVIDDWQPGRKVDLYTEFQTAIRRSTIESLFGRRLAANEATIARDLRSSLALAGNDPWRFELRRRFRSPAWRRAVRGRRRVEILVRAEIREREQNPEANDLLSDLMTDSRSSRLSEVEVVDQVISLIAAGYETTSAAFGWICQELVTENCAGFRSAHIVAESLRLHPPAVVIGRRVVRAFDYEGTRIPVGRLLLLSPYVTHRSLKVWTDPHRFDPSRWDTEQAGYRKPARGEYLPFGAGLHQCVGARLAELQLETLVDALRERANLRPIKLGAPRGVNVAALRPKGGVWVLVDEVRPRSEPI